MRLVVLGILMAATMALSACGASGEGDGPQAKGETCGYDRKTLLPALEAAVPSDATLRMTMEMSGAATAEFDTVIAYTPTGAEMELTSRTPGEEFALVVVDNRLFVSDSAAGKVYRELDGSDPVAARLRDQAASMDVTSTFDAWRAGLDKVEQAGEEEIDGERVCHYSLTVDTTQAAAANGDSLPQGMPQTIVYELFLTADDLMRRVQFDLGGLEAEMNATHWNEPVDIEVPPVR